jgi:hypothetical protein
MMDKLSMLTDAKKHREDEVLEYQINIDNYRLAIVKAAQDPDMVEFKAQLESLLTSSIIEQKKAKIMLEVLTEQLNTMS